jgi:pimeloyl-ACP methyl ester carboxylesterase
MAARNVNGVPLECREHGRGAPVVFVHGSAADLRTWDSQLATFGSTYRAVAYSRRYHWPNQTIAEGADYVMETHVEDLRALLMSIGGEPAHLVGHSYGAFVALELALREPALARSLVLEEAPVVTLFVSNDPTPLEIARLLVTRPRTAVTLLRFGATGLGPAKAAARAGNLDEAMRIFGRAVLGPDVHASLSDERREQVRVNSFTAEFLGSGFPPLDPAAVRRVATPTLLVEGSESPPLFHRLNDRLGELLPAGDRVAIPRASHIAHEDNPDDYDAALLAFMARVDGGKENRA